MTERLVDAAAIADLLAVPQSWVLAQARNDAIPHRRLGRYVRFSPDEVRAWVDGLAQGGGPRYRRHVPTTTEGAR
jgi:excisionase family DNA binding protein